MNIYVAGPYQIGDKEQNVKNTIDAAEHLSQHGFIPIVPLLSHYWHIHYHHPHEFWMTIDYVLLSICDIMVFLPGKSKGVEQEVQWANAMNIPVIPYDKENVIFHIHQLLSL